jgi:VWFA-related protein
MTFRPLVIFVCVLTLASPWPSRHAAGQGPELAPQVKILSPARGAFVIGRTLLRAAVEPPHLVSNVVFFVDGRTACTTTAPPFECEWDAGSTVREHQVRLVVNLVAGGRVVQTVRTKSAAFAETVDVDVVQVTATVMDGRGRRVKGLPKAAFRLAEDGRPQTISHFYSNDAPLELLVAVDVSASMRPAMSTLRRVVSDFLIGVPSQHHVTMLGFNDRTFTLAPRTTDRAERLKAMDGVTAWGATVLYDAIWAGVEALEAQAGRKALVVFSDGEDVGSLATLAEVERRLQASDLTLYMIGLGQGLTSAALKGVMERLSRPTGGRVFFATSLDELNDAFKELLEDLAHQYGLGYQPTNSVRDDTWRQITVDVDGYSRVRARQGYRASPPLAASR